jgi:tryptophan-rich sensory protein
MRYLASPAQLRASIMRWALFTVPAVVGLGFLSGRVSGTGPNNPWFEALEKPGIYPPPAAFGIVWTVLYVMMGIALAMILAARGAQGRGIAIGAFLFQLALNLAWSPVFFLFHRISLALIIIILLIAVVAVTIALCWRVRRPAGVLLLPYLVWICFASLLNLQLLQLNPWADGVDQPAAAVRVKL